MSGKQKAPENIQDVVAALYMLRDTLDKVDLAMNDTILIDSWFDDEVFPLIIRYKGIETIETELGEIECQKFMPVVGVGRVFETQDDMQIYISNDKNRLPIRIKFDIFIGSLKCDLIEYSGLKYPLKIGF